MPEVIMETDDQRDYSIHVNAPTTEQITHLAREMRSLGMRGTFCRVSDLSTFSVGYDDDDG